MTWKRESYTGREELRFVFDPKVTEDDSEAKRSALDHLDAMADPITWLQDQVAFDIELMRAKKLADKEQSRRLRRWQMLKAELKARAA